MTVFGGAQDFRRGACPQILWQVEIEGFKTMSASVSVPVEPARAAR
jgi:hypothetical protein